MEGPELDEGPEEKTCGAPDCNKTFIITEARFNGKKCCSPECSKKRADAMTKARLRKKKKAKKQAAAEQADTSSASGQALVEESAKELKLAAAPTLGCTDQQQQQPQASPALRRVTDL